MKALQPNRLAANFQGDTYQSADNFRSRATTAYDRLVARSRHPGLAKTRGLPLLRRREIELWQSTDYRWRELFEAADVMSEGATRDEPEGRVYYGSTSVLLPVKSQGGLLPDDELEQVTRLLGADPHARVRAVRIACLEAELRSGGPLGRVSAELAVRQDKRGARVDVEVEARVFERPGRRLRGAPGARRDKRRKSSS